ncbi:MAG: FAD-binding oxidoreductase [Hyphomicrobiaceae bacterium]
MTADGSRPPLNAPSEDLIRRLTGIVGPEHALVDPDQQLPYLREMRDVYFGKSPLVLRPATVEQVSKCLALLNEARVPVVPQAGNTGLVGGQVPYERGDEVVLSIARLNKVRNVDAIGYNMTLEAGMTLADVQAQADKVDRYFPLSLPSEGSCRIGGNLGTNAGGVAVLAYGNTRQLVLGLEVVLADGRIVPGLKALKKDNTGYDLRDLFIGSEGTLGIITAVTLKLFPKPAERATAFIALPELDAALELFRLAHSTALTNLTAFEFLSREGLEMLVKHFTANRIPFDAPYPWYVLMEISGAKPDGQAARELEAILTEAAEADSIEDAVIASSLSQAADFWRLRELMPEAQKPEGGSVKHDVSVPIARLPEFIRRANEIVENVCHGIRPVPFGHFGDGNIHYNLSEPVGMGKEKFMAMGNAINAAVHDLVHGLGGSISAEHGIGRSKRDELVRFKSPVEMELMRGIKQVFDPNGILNPGKVL